MEQLQTRLTGNKNLDIKLLSKMTNEDIFKICESDNTYIKSLCEHPMLWVARILNRYGKYGIDENIIMKLGQYINLTSQELYYFLHNMFINDTDSEYMISIIPTILENTSFIDQSMLQGYHYWLPKFINQQEFIFYLRQIAIKYILLSQYPDESFDTVLYNSLGVSLIYPFASEDDFVLPKPIENKINRLKAQQNLMSLNEEISRSAYESFNI